MSKANTIQHQKIIIVGGGVAAAEMGTLLGQHTNTPIEIVEIESNPERKFGGWAFQDFPKGVRTNRSLQKMHLNTPEEIVEWANNRENRTSWPERYKDIDFSPEKIFPRVLIKEYVQWRRNQVNNENVHYTSVTAEAMHVRIDKEEGKVHVRLKNGEIITGDRLVMASGSIAVKVPTYLEPIADHHHVIKDPLTRTGHEARQNIPLGSKVLILGTGLTGEEQVNLLHDAGHTDLTLLSRQGKQHYAYPELQKNKPLVFTEKPAFLVAETPEEFQTGLKKFYAHYTAQGHCAEDILNAIRPHWESVRAELGGCVKAVDRLKDLQRDLAINSIGVSFEVASRTQSAINQGHLTLRKGYIQSITNSDNKLFVEISPDGKKPCETVEFDYIINAVGRTIIRHPIWKSLLSEGLANKHASIGVQVSETGQMMDAQGEFSDLIYVVGMPRAGDHTFRHGFLGNTAFNVAQVRSHVGGTVEAMLADLTGHALISELDSTGPDAGVKHLQM